MAERTISTRLIVEGEKEYREQMKQINREHKTLQSELKKVESEYNGNANSLEALTAKNKVLNDLLQKQNERLKQERDSLKRAEDVKKSYSAAIEEARRELQRLEETTSDSEKETEDYRRQVDELNKSIARLESAEEKASAAVESHKQKINAAEVSINDYSRELKQNTIYLEEAQRSNQKCATSIDRFGKTTDNLKSRFSEFTDKLTTTPGIIGAVSAAMGIAVEVGQRLAEVAADTVKSYVEWEQAFVKVSKTVEASSAQIAALEKEIRSLSLEIPVTAVEIAEVAAAAGQLGIATEDIMSFAETMIRLGVSTNLSAEEAATALARFMNITGLSTDMVDELGSVIVQLGNNSATTEAEIVNMMTNLASAGTQIGLTEPQIAAIAATLSSLGLEAEAGGTAFSRTMIEIQAAVATGSKDLTGFATVAGMSATEFSAAWRGDPMAALMAFFDGLSNGSRDSIVILEELGITETRQRDTLLRVKEANEQLAESIELANEEWENSTALLKESNKVYDTYAGQFAIVNNEIEEQKTLLGEELAPVVLTASQDYSKLLEALTWVVDKMTFLHQAYAENRLAQQELNESVNQGAETLAEFGTAVEESMGSASENFNEEVEEMIPGAVLLQNTMDGLLATYHAAYEAAYESINQQIGTFEYMAEVVPISVGDTIASFESQIEFMDTYANNMATIMEWGVNKGLVAKLSDGSVESARILQGMVDGGEEEVTRLSEAFERTEDAKNIWAGNMAAMAERTDEEFSNIEQDVDDMISKFNQYDEALTAGEETVQGYIDGLNRRLAELESIAARVRALGSTTGSSRPGRYATGLDYVPYDEFPALLHKGEMVLTAAEAAAYRADATVNYYVNNLTENKPAAVPAAVSHSLNVYPQQMSDAQTDYLLKKFNRMMGRMIH